METQFRNRRDAGRFLAGKLKHLANDPDDLDYAVCTGPGISGAIKGLPIKLIMTTQDRLGYLLLVKSNVQKLPDLRGKTIGISSFGSQSTSRGM